MKKGGDRLSSSCFSKDVGVLTPRLKVKRSKEAKGGVDKFILFLSHHSKI